MTFDDATSRATGRQIGKRLQAARMALGWTQRDVERATGGAFGQRILAYYERGERRVPAVRLVALAQVYGLSPSEVLNDAGPLSAPEVQA